MSFGFHSLVLKILIGADFLFANGLWESSIDLLFMLDVEEISKFRHWWEVYVSKDCSLLRFFDRFWLRGWLPLFLFFLDFLYLFLFFDNPCLSLVASGDFSVCILLLSFTSFKAYILRKMYIMKITINIII